MAKKKTKKKSPSKKATSKRTPSKRTPSKRIEPEVLPPASKSEELESVMFPEEAAALEISMRGRGTSKPISLQQMVDQVQCLELLDGVALRNLLLKQLELASLQGISAANVSLGFVNDQTTTEPAREVLITRLVKLSLFNESATRQRLSILKAGFIDEEKPKEEVDPADLTNEEWEAKYSNRILPPAPIPNVKQ
jgi:hypothetical protein